VVPFSPLHSEGGIGTGTEFRAPIGDLPFSPLHSEGGIGTDLYALFSTSNSESLLR